MRPKGDASDAAVFILSQGRERRLEWDHPITGEEGDIQSLINDNLFNDGDQAELAALCAALQDQRIKDSREYHDNRAEFDRKWTASFCERKAWFDRQFRKATNK